MYKIAPDVKDFVESGVAAAVATGDESGRPQVRYGWAPRVHADGSTVDVFLDASRAVQTLDNLLHNGRIAMTMAHPVSYRSVQLKGRFLSSGDPGADDLAWVDRGREAFAVAASLVGDPPETIRNLWTQSVIRVSFAVEQAFDQTPGPSAGRAL